MDQENGPDPPRNPSVLAEPNSTEIIRKLPKTVKRFFNGSRGLQRAPLKLAADLRIQKEAEQPE